MSVIDTPIYQNVGLDLPGLNLPDLPDEISVKLAALTDAEASAATALAGKRAAANSTAEDRFRAKADLDTAESRSVVDPSVSEKHLDSLRERFDRAKKREAAAESEANRAAQTHRAVQQVVASVEKLLNGRRTFEPIHAKAGGLQSVADRGRIAGYDLTLVPVDLPAGDPTEIVTAQRVAINRLVGEKAGVEQAPAPKEMILRQAIGKIDSDASRAEITVSIGTGDDSKRGVQINWPKVSIGAAPAHARDAGFIPRVIDLEALACKFWRDEIAAAVTASVEEQYLGVDQTFEPHEKRRRLKELDAQILEAERIECAAVWKLIESGATGVFFRPDTNPAAILGVA